MTSGKPDNNKNDNDDLQMFNDRQWKDQWYMVRSLCHILPTNLLLTINFLIVMGRNQNSYPNLMC